MKNKEEKAKKEKDKILKGLEEQFKTMQLTQEELDAIEDCPIAVPDPEVGQVVITAADIRKCYDKARNL